MQCRGSVLISVACCSQSYCSSQIEKVTQHAEWLLFGFQRESKAVLQEAVQQSSSLHVQARHHYVHKGQTTLQIRLGTYQYMPPEVNVRCLASLFWKWQAEESSQRLWMALSAPLNHPLLQMRFRNKSTLQAMQKIDASKDCTFSGVQ